MRRLVPAGVACVALWLAAPAVAQEAAPAKHPKRAEIDRLVEPFVRGEFLVGVSVGVLDGGRAQSWGYGRTGLPMREYTPPDGRTLYEIGSISKVFTGLLLASAVERGEVTLEQSAAELLPEGRSLPAHGKTAITLLDIATHTSGLPRMPSNFAPADRANPYADYTAELMFEFLAGAKLNAKPGTAYVYSNLGAGLLGHLLALKAGKPRYEPLLMERVVEPLKMTDTSITVPAERRKRFARPHGPDGTPSANWDLAVLAGAGAIRSTTNDMLKFAAANLAQGEDAPLRKEFALARAKRRPTGRGAHIGLFWQIAPDGVVWHNGQTGGYHSYLAIDFAKRQAVVVLSNTANGHPDAIGRAILQVLAGETPALKPPPAPVQVPEATLQAYEGAYHHPAGAVMTITREGTKLFAQLTGQPRFRIFPTSDREFAWRVVKAKAVFDAPPKDAEGAKSPRLVLHQSGRTIPFERK